MSTPVLEDSNLPNPEEADFFEVPTRGSGTPYAIHLRPGVIYDFCEARGFSRAQLARLTGLTDNTLYRADAGLSLPSPRFIAALIVHTGLDFGHWFQLVAVADSLPENACPPRPSSPGTP